MANQNRPASHSLVVTLGAAINQWYQQHLLVRKSPGFDIQLRCFLDLLPGRKPPLLTPLLRSNKQSITALDTELFILLVLVLHRNDGFPLHDYTLCHAPRINMFFTYRSYAVFFFLTVSYSLFSNIPSVLFVVFGTSANTIRYSFHYC